MFLIKVLIRISKFIYKIFNNFFYYCKCILKKFYEFFCYAQGYTVITLNNFYFLKILIKLLYILFSCFKVLLKIFVLYHWHVFIKFYLMFLKLGWVYIVTAWLYLVLNYLAYVDESTLNLDIPEAVVYPFITHINIIAPYENLFDLVSFSFVFL